MTANRLRTAALLTLSAMITLASVGYSSMMQRQYVVVKFAAVLTGGMALLGLVASLVLLWRRGRELRDPLVVLLAAEVGVLALSVTFSIQPWVSLLGRTPRLLGAITVVCFIVAALGVILGAGDRRERLVFILRTVVISSAVVALNALWEWPTHPEFRPPGLIGNAEFLSNHLLFAALGGIGLLLLEERAAWAWVATVGAALAAVGVAVLKTRGAWLGLGAGIVLLTFLAAPGALADDLVARSRRRLIELWLTVLLVAAATSIYGRATAAHPIGQEAIGWHALHPFLAVIGFGVLLVPWLAPRIRWLRHAMVGLVVVATILTAVSAVNQAPFLPHQAAESLRLTQQSVRGEVRNNTYTMLKDYWLVGCGVENYRVAFLKYKSDKVARADPRVNYENPHNMLLNEFASNGILGFLVYVGLLGVGFWGFLVARRRTTGTAWSLLSTALLAAFAAYCVQNLFNYDVISTGLLCFVWLGMSVVLRRTAGPEPEPTPAPAPVAAEPAPASAPAPAAPVKLSPSEARAARRQRLATAATAPAAAPRPTPPAPALSGKRQERRDAEVREAVDGFRRIIALVGIGGLVILGLMYLGTTDVFRLVIEGATPDDKPDTLRNVLFGSWIGIFGLAWLAAPVIVGYEPQASDEIARGTALQNRGALALVLGLGAIGAWWSGRNLVADWCLYRANATAGYAASTGVSRVSQIQSQLRMLAQTAAQQRAQGQTDAGYQRQEAVLNGRLAQESAQLARHLQRVIALGDRALRNVPMMGEMHFQYSKLLHGFLKARQALPDHVALTKKSYHHARKGLRNSTNQESAWSHLAVVHLAMNDLAEAKRALARSIALDPFYYDNHRMMAVLELQDGEVDRAVAEIERALDITERIHQVNSQTAALRLAHALEAKDDAAADQARREMWHWIKRSRLSYDLPDFVFGWIQGDRNRTRFIRALEVLLKQDAGAADAAIADLETATGAAALDPNPLRYLRALYHALHGDPSQIRALASALVLRSGSHDPISAVGQIGAGLGAAEGDFRRLRALGSRPSRDPRQAERTWAEAVERVATQGELYAKYVLHSLADDHEASGGGPATPAMQELARLAAELWKRRLERNATDRFPAHYRQQYGQVVSVYEQVMRAASKTGRVETAGQLVMQRQHERALRALDAALKRFGDPYPQAHLYRGMALEGLKRFPEARQAFEKSLAQDPASSQAEQIRARLERLPR
jgi:tetratricopeptide (TPR) repeat protein